MKTSNCSNLIVIRYLLSIWKEYNLELMLNCFYWQFYNVYQLGGFEKKKEMTGHVCNYEDELIYYFYNIHINILYIVYTNK